MKRTIIKIVMVISLIVMLIIGPICASAGAAGAFMVIWVVGFAILIVCSSLLRCPHCGMNLGRSTLYAQYCPHCGEKLDD